MNAVDPEKKKAKRNACNTFTKKVIGQKIKENIFKVNDHPNDTANFWRSYQLVVDEKNVQTGYVKCKFCNRIDVYNTYKGTKGLKSHAAQCNALSKNPSILKYTKKKNCITKEEKTALTKAALELCYKDIRPFPTPY